MICRSDGSLMFIYDQKASPLEIGAFWMASTVQVLPPSKQPEFPSFSVSSINSQPIWAL
jgi:hypothetical protein